jgi:hypothetical protein
VKPVKPAGILLKRPRLRHPLCDDPGKSPRQALVLFDKL